MRKMLDVVFILDKSGSMSGSEENTITSFNEYLEKEKKNDYKTPLYDAIGSAINYIDRCDTDKVLFIIITDGYENASSEFNKDKVRRMIKNHSNYEFIYIGADIDSYSAGGSIGIDKDNIANFKKDRMGTGLLFKSVGKFESSMMEDSEISSWKKDLDDYIKENGE